MKKKLIGIIICMLLISTITPVTGKVTNSIKIKYTDNVISPLLNNKWTKTYNLNREDGGSSVQQTPDGGYIIIGGTREKVVTQEVDWDYWLIKTDSQGNILWDKVFGGEKDDAPQMIKLTSDGGYIIIGFTESYGAGGNDVWLIKTDSNGNILWDKTFGDIYQDYGMDIEQTDDGGYIIVGLKGVSEAQKDDAWLIKTDEFGNMVWNRTFGGSEIDEGYSVVQTLDGGYIVAGFFYSEETSRDAWLIKTDEFGNMVWNRTFGGSEIDEGYSVELTDDGGYILTGVYSYHTPDANAFLIKTDDEGEILWEKEFGEGDEYYGFEVHQTADGGYIIIGFKGLFYNYFDKDGYGSDGLLIKTNSEGEEEWTKFYGNRFLNDLIGRGHQTTDGGYILIGWADKHILTWPFYDNIMDLLLIKTDSNGKTPRNINIRSNVNLPRNRTSFFGYHWLRFFDMFPLLQRILNYIL